MHLSHAQVGFMSFLQQRCFLEEKTAIILLSLITQLTMVYILVRHNSGDNAYEAMLLALLQVKFAKVKDCVKNFDFYQYVDYILHDIPPEEDETIILKQRENICFNSWSDWECYHYTNFHKDQLERIYACFELQTVSDPMTGNVRIHTGFYNQRGIPCAYNFNPEELFLYLMTRMKTGHDHTQMCFDIFGGSPRRWSYAWMWIMHYLDDRYQNIIGHQGLTRFVDQFPDFFEAIQEKVQQSYIVDNHDGTYDETDGLAFLPFDVFGFIDCSIDKISKPFSGPADDYMGGGTKRRILYSPESFLYWTQRDSWYKSGDSTLTKWYQSLFWSSVLSSSRCQWCAKNESCN